MAKSKPTTATRIERLGIFVPSSCTEIALLDEDGDEVTSDTTYGQHLIIFSNEDGGLLDDSVPYGSIFFLRIRLSNALYMYSQPLLHVLQADESLLSTLKYRCDEDALGFPFTTTQGGEYDDKAYAIADVPIRLHSPQNVQDDKTYVKANGEVVTLYAKYYKEWDGETEYLSAEMHDKIVAALSCDEVYINYKRVTKSDKYQVDWENYDLDCDGVTKLARATFKVRENITQRNSNF